MRVSWTVWTFGALFVALTTPGFGQNLLSNPEFDASQGLGSWFTNAIGTWALDADSARCSQSNAALGTSAPTTPDYQALSTYATECFEVDPVVTPVLEMGFSYRTTAQVWARGYLQYFSDGACGTHLDWSAGPGGGAAPTWTAVAGAIQILGSAGSVRVWIDFIPQELPMSQFTASIDRIFLGSGAPVYADGFEADSGSACRWSTAQGEGP